MLSLKVRKTPSSGRLGAQYVAAFLQFPLRASGKYAIWPTAWSESRQVPRTDHLCVPRGVESLLTWTASDSSALAPCPPGGQIGCVKVAIIVRLPPGFVNEASARSALVATNRLHIGLIRLTTKSSETIPTRHWSSM